MVVMYFMVIFEGKLKRLGGFDRLSSLRVLNKIAIDVLSTSTAYPLLVYISTSGASRNLMEDFYSYPAAMAHLSWCRS